MGWLFALAAVVGLACGAVLAFELHPRGDARNTWRHWLGFAVAALVVAGCAVAAEALDKQVHPGAGVKALAIALLAASFAVAFRVVSRRR